MCKLKTSSTRATEWGRGLATYLRGQGESNPFLLAVKWGWRVVLENAEQTSPLLPARLAEWDGSRRMIRLFVPTLRCFLGDSTTVLWRACAHELFHGLVALNYQSLQLTAADFPPLSYSEEEAAAQVFSEVLSSSQL
jgi:hypothetical protein